MPSELEVIAGDFTREMQVIENLVTRVSGVQEEAGPQDASVRVAASNASMLLLAASFEEFIRELAKEFCIRLIRSAASFGDLPGEMASAAWERCLQILRGLRYGKPDFDSLSATASIRVLDGFCLRQEVGADVSELIGYNQNNMRIKEINDIFRRVGISDVCGCVGRRDPIIEFFGAASGNVAHAKFVSHIEEFYETRNEIAHSIGSLRMSGSVQISRHLDFFRCTASAFAAELSSRVDAGA